MDTKDTNIEQESLYYRIGDFIDAKYLDDGTWWEAKIVKITSNPESEGVAPRDDGLLYHVLFEG